MKRLAFFGLTLILWVFLGLAAPAEAQLRNLSFDEKQKVRAALDLVEEMFEKAGRLDAKMTDWLNAPGDPGGAGGQIGYEDNNATFRDAINKLRDKIDSNRVQVRQNNRDGGSTRNRNGTDADIVILNAGQLTKMCSSGDDGGRLLRKFSLASTLANEMVHVWQVFTGDDLKQCDAERDSDTSTLIFLCALAFELEGVTDPADIDAEECPVLAKCIAAYGVTAGAEWNHITRNVPGMKEYYEKRREEKFDNLINSSLSWGEGYYGEGDYRGPIKFAEVTGVDQLRLTAADGSERFYTLPVGKRVLRRAVSRNEAGQVVLTIVAQDMNTNVICTYVYTDTDGDTLPEPTPQVTQASAPANDQTDDNAMFMMPRVPGDANDTQNGWTLIDTTDGTVYEIPVDPFTLQPLFPFFDVVAFDPILSAQSGFFYFDEVVFSDPFFEVWLFSQTPLVMNHGDQPAMLMEIDLQTGQWNPVFVGLIAEALGQLNDGGILQLDAGLANIELMGPPDANAMLLFADGPPTPLLPQPVPIGSNGLTGALPVQPLSPGLFFVDILAGPTLINRVELFQPPLGENIDCILVEENGDTNPERLHLTVDPPRLHVFEGQPGAPDPIFESVYELVLETDEARSFLTWDDVNGRAFSTMTPDDFVFEMSVPVPGFNAPLFVQSLHDLDGDTAQDDTAYAFATDLSGTNYTFTAVQNIATTPLPLSFTNLSFVPGVLAIVDLDGDTLPDAVMTDHAGGPDQCFLNDGSGALLPGSCPSDCLADVNGDGLVTPADFTAWINAFNNNLPQCDQNSDNACTPSDFTAWIANFNAGC